VREFRPITEVMAITTKTHNVRR